VQDYQAILKELSAVTEAVTKGDLSKTLSGTSQGQLGDSKRTMNNMTGILRHFASEVTRVTHEVGTMGKLGGQASFDGVEGTWKELTETVNNMAEQLTHQTRNVASVTTAVADGDMTKLEMPAEAQGTLSLLSCSQPQARSASSQ
jgi:osomolarity two-component system, sensor histidine kinase NIK1